MRNWDKKEDVTLRRLVGLGHPFSEVARIMNRTVGAVSGRCGRLDLRRVRPERGGRPMVDTRPRGGCTWIEGDPRTIRDLDAAHCGEPVVEGGSWCGPHRERVFRRPEEKEDVNEK